ncbi:TetR/AcrR family transcriptional regulator [Microbacterium sp. 179-I 3D2 NHS]|uniref:TetR/AcrR family transcriptional regulator n=1 Tax=Microbacterium sp. 179-I 3D2 NHS TaxID=3235178 RepID=UPI0039A3182B
MTNSAARMGRPPVTSRDRIIAAARDLIDRDGWERLTLRRLAGELGIGTTTLYHHVRDREALLLLLLNDYFERTPVPSVPEDAEQRIVTVALAMRDALAAWPWATEVLAADGFIAVLGDSALSYVEAIVSGAKESGRSNEEAVTVFRSIWYYTVGEILVRANSARVRAEGWQPDVQSHVDRLDASRMPGLSSIGARWGEFAARDTYPDGLRALVRGLLSR